MCASSGSHAPALRAGGFNSLASILAPKALEMPEWLQVYARILQFVYVAFLTFLVLNCIISVMLDTYSRTRKRFATAMATHTSERGDRGVSMVRRRPADMLCLNDPGRSGAVPALLVEYYL